MKPLLLLLAINCTLLYTLQSQNLPVPTSGTPSQEEEEIFRTSEHGQRYTYSKRTPNSKPKGERIGSICMDNTPSIATAGGACSSHGGVKYWIYEFKDTNGKPARMYTPTQRALNQNASLAPVVRGYSNTQEEPEYIDFEEVITPTPEDDQLLKWLIIFAIVVVICATLIVIVKKIL